MKWYKLEQDIKNKSITKLSGSDLNFVSPLEKQNNNVQINADFVNKVNNLKGLDKATSGDNIVIQQQGDEYWFNTSDNLTLSSIRARSGVLNMESETHFKNIPHIEQGIIIENRDLQISSEIDMLDKDLKVINNNGDILLKDKTGIINPRTLKANQDELISKLSKAVILIDKGEWNAQTTYKEFDLVRHNGDKYWLDKASSINEEPTPQNKFWIDYTPTISEPDTYTKPEIDNMINDVDAAIKFNTNDISQLKLKDNLLQQEINDISINHQLSIDPTQEKNWNDYLLYAELDGTDITKGTIKIVPSDLKEYQLKQSLKTTAQDLAVVKGELKDILTSTNKTEIKQLFYGAENKDADPRIYGYSTTMGTIPLIKQQGIITFGNIFDVDYREWEGVFYNNIKIPFGTNNDSVGIDLTNQSFNSKTNIENITLYKEVVNDGVVKSEVVVFYQGEIKFFGTKATFENTIKTKFNLVEGVDYQEVPLDKAFMTGVNGVSKTIGYLAIDSNLTPLDIRQFYGVNFKRDITLDRKVG